HVAIEISEMFGRLDHGDAGYARCVRQLRSPLAPKREGVLQRLHALLADDPRSLEQQQQSQWMTERELTFPRVSQPERSGDHAGIGGQSVCRRTCRSVSSKPVEHARVWPIERKTRCARRGQGVRIRTMAVRPGCVSPVTS